MAENSANGAHKLSFTVDEIENTLAQLKDEGALVDDEKPVSASSIQEAVDQVLEGKLIETFTYEVPDKELRKPMGEIKIMPDNMHAFSGNEEGELTIIGDNTLITGLTVNGIDYKTFRRKKINEDGLFVDANSKTVMVTDGVGGAGKGEVATNIANHIMAQLLKKSQKAGTPAIPLQETVNKMHRAVKEYQKNNGAEHARASATMVAARIKNDRTVEFVHLGDSKGLLVRGREIKYETRDDNVYEYIKAIHKFDDAAAREYFNRKPGMRDDAIIQSLGCVEACLDMEGNEFSKDRVNPNYKEVKGIKGDVVVLCSDGLTDTLSPEDIASYIDLRRKKGVALNVIADEIKQTVLDKMKKDEGKPDNLTISLIELT